MVLGTKEIECPMGCNAGNLVNLYMMVHCCYLWLGGSLCLDWEAGCSEACIPVLVLISSCFEPGEITPVSLVLYLRGCLSMEITPISLLLCLVSSP